MSKTLPAPTRNVRAILIQQQEHAPQVALPLPTLLRNPFLLLLWTLVLSTVVAALLLGRIRVPRTAHGLVVAERAGRDSVTSVLLLPAWTRDFLHAGEHATIDTGGGQRLTLTIASIDAQPLTLASARHWLATPNASPTTIDTSMVVARLEPCTRCPQLATGARYTAVTHLGTRSLASFAAPST
jgi:hypothetical protein